MIMMNHHHTDIEQFGSPPSSDQIFNLTTWKPFAATPPPDTSTSSAAANVTESTTTDHHHHQFYHNNHEFNPTGSQHGSQQGGQLSLSLSSTMGLQNHTTFFQHQQQFQFPRQPPSRYLGPAQELLNEFCSLKQVDTPSPTTKPKQNHNKNDVVDSNQQSSGGSSSVIGSVEFLELQKRKTKLLSLLSEVDRKYRHYCDQMRAVVSSFEAVAGAGAATVYSALASKAMSRHFRCLRDGIVAQIQATKKAMGEKDPVVPGTTRGETPRLKVVDQAVRQQRAFQQMNGSIMDSQPWRPQRGLPEKSVSLLRAWLFEHFLHPYPSDVDKHILARQTGLSRSQVSNWFINARVRLWKPMVEELYIEETKDNNIEVDTDDDIQNLMIMSSSDQATTSQYVQYSSSEQKPTHDQLVRIDSDCLSSIISSNPDHKTDHHHHQWRIQDNSKVGPSSSSSQHQGFGTMFGAVELDFSSSNYNHHHDHQSADQGGFHQQMQGGGVSLTLGLQQHGGLGSNGIFFQRDQNDQDCQQEVQYSSLLDGLDQGGNGGVQNLPYRNLMGGHQLLHDLAG
ncbi:Homeobox protein BEL1 homolog [Linum grandiflorum]